MAEKSTLHGKPAAGIFGSTAVTIASGASESSAVDARNWGLARMFIPAGWVASDLGFLFATSQNGAYSVAKDGSSTPVPLKITGINVTTAFNYQLPYTTMTGQWMKLRKMSTTANSTAAVNQTGGAVTIWFSWKG